MQRKIGTAFRKRVQTITILRKHRSIIRYREQVNVLARFFRVYLHAHQAIIGLTIFILLANAMVVQAASEIPTLPADAVVSDPYDIADTVRLLGDYTPGIEENADEIALTLEERLNRGSFITTNPLIATLPGEVDEPTPTPQVKQPEVATAPTKRVKDIKYTVEIGDTLSGIGSKFGLKLATIKVKNGINDVDSLKPGQELTIPAQDLTDKALKAADDRKKASVAYASDTGPKKNAGGYGLIVPVRHNGITRRLVGGHTGIDYRANVGSPVMAADDGVVVVADESGWNGGYGKTVLISHGGGRTSRYGHLSDVRVGNGQQVGQGTVIGLSGNSGRSTGPHLHFEFRINGSAVDPGT